MASKLEQDLVSVAKEYNTTVTLLTNRKEWDKFFTDNQKKIYVVVMMASYCGPCRSYTPTVVKMQTFSNYPKNDVALAFVENDVIAKVWPTCPLRHFPSVFLLKNQMAESALPGSASGLVEPTLPASKLAEKLTEMVATMPAPSKKSTLTRTTTTTKMTLRYNPDTDYRPVTKFALNHVKTLQTMGYNIEIQPTQNLEYSPQLLLGSQMLYGPHANSMLTRLIEESRHSASRKTST